MGTMSATTGRIECELLSLWELSDVDRMYLADTVDEDDASVQFFVYDGSTYSLSDFLRVGSGWLPASPAYGDAHAINHGMCEAVAIRLSDDGDSVTAWYIIY